MIGIALAMLSAAVTAVAIILVGRNSKETNTVAVSLIISLTGLIVILPFAAVLTDFSTVNIEAYCYSQEEAY